MVWIVLIFYEISHWPIQHKFPMLGLMSEINICSVACDYLWAHSALRIKKAVLVLRWKLGVQQMPIQSWLNADWKEESSSPCEIPFDSDYSRAVKQ